MEIPMFPGKYHQNGGFSMAMVVYRSVPARKSNKNTDDFVDVVGVHIWAYRSPSHDSQMVTGILLFSFCGDFLGGGFKYFFYFHPYLGKCSNLTNIFQLG